MSKQKILILRFSSLGDILFALPVCYHLKTHFPECHITWMALGSYQKLLKMSPYIDDIINPNFQSGYGVKKDLMEILRLIQKGNEKRYDVVLDLHGTDKSHLVAWGIRAKEKIAIDRSLRHKLTGFKIVPVHWNNSSDRVAFHLIPLRILGIEAKGPRYDLDCGNEARDNAMKFLKENRIWDKPFVAIHPGSSQAVKNWGIQNYLRLADAVLDSWGVNAVVLLGETEKEYEYECLKQNRHPFKCFVNDDIPFLAALMERAVCCIGNESGPMHLAEALGIPTVFLMGPSNACIEAASGPQRRIIRKGLFCSPCYTLFETYETCRFGTQDCMKLIRMEEVLAAVEDLLMKEKIQR